MSSYNQPPAYGPSPYPTPPRPNVAIPFILQALLGFFGTLAYGTVMFFLLIFTAMNYGLPPIIPNLVFFGGMGLGIAFVLFITVYFRWYGFLAGALLAVLVPVLLVGACTIFFLGSLGASSY
ncbi:MAG: hypothetical protein SNJ67_12820 [Chloracidobacterium sp.]|uniref:Uncharacterized protein n=1 Tax=Chloracidobacterium validum TaxID=2821543 RepID=A0ABX8BDL9_9BACT|nr:hypothetical protein [Chloracidobacterium validum]QUW03165.1 hypothetical protein J8C06_01605 [Chloracidobacterium validum]